MTLHLSITASQCWWQRCSIWFNLVVQCRESVSAVCSGSNICQLNLQKILCREELSFCFTLIFLYTCSYSPTEESVAKCHLIYNKNFKNKKQNNTKQNNIKQNKETNKKKPPPKQNPTKKTPPPKKSLFTLGRLLLKEK